MTHPKFTPNPSAAKPDARRAPGSVVTVRVRAMHSELDARYKDLVQSRHDRVSELSDSKVGYLHVPDMERFGYGEFWRRFPKESKKKALVVDLRGNCGGHISELILAKLAQRPLAFDVPRRGAPTAYPSHASGFVVTLVDQDTGSDAELAAHAFRRTKLGPDRRESNLGRFAHRRRRRRPTG
jgi:C-terminal processing protease CtpA/Prc